MSEIQINAERLKCAGLRPTRQRIDLSALLWHGEGHRHVTAEMLHAEAKMRGMAVSLATVYNTLHQFTDAGLLREIALGGGRCYFDTNACCHHHFLNEDNGELIDIPAECVVVAGIPLPPLGMSQVQIDVIVRVRNA